MHDRVILVFRSFATFMLLAASLSLSARPVSAEDFDWRNVNGQNWVTSVKSQFGGTCWDFAACGSLEAKYMLTRDDTTYQPDVSEQHINWETNPDMGSMDGGQTYKVMDYFVSHGVVLESECPTQGTDTGSSPYWPLGSGWENRVFKAASDSTSIAQGTNIDYVKACLKTYGPTTIWLEADNDFYPDPGSFRGTHEVVLVGYHDNLPGESAPGGGYWIIKNSWGEYYDQFGYGYDGIAYGSEPSYEDVWYDWYDIFHVNPHYNRDICALTGQVYFTGAMATVTWGGGGRPWTLGSNNWSGTDMYGNTLSSYTWDNSEATAIFGASTGKTVTISGPVVAHGLVINSGATGYVFNGINGGVLTVTGGGIVAHESAAINTSVKIGAPQSWTIDSGKSLYIGGDLHTIISPLTINGDGNITITGNIDGGGALNAMGAAPGAITKTGAGILHLTGAATYSVPLTAAGQISFEQNGSDCAYFTNTIAGSTTVYKYNSGTVVLSASNSYTGWTRICGGVVQADVNTGIPNQSAVVLDGGVLQSNSAVTYTDSFWWETSDYRCVSIWSGGFAGGGGKMTVNLRGNGSDIKWTGDGDSGIAGNLILSSTTAQYEVEIQNRIDLNGGERTIRVDDNPNSSGDFATISGVITDSVGWATGTWTAGLVKNGPGRLVLTAANEYGDGAGYAGNTTINQGVLQADRNVGLSGWSGLILNGGVLQSNSAITFTDQLWQLAPDSHCVTWNSGGFAGGPGKMTVCIGNNAAQTVAWTGDGHTGIVGTVILSSTSAQSEVEIQNGLNLAGGARTIQVDDNPDSSGDFATLSGALSDSVGGATLTKTGLGTLYLKGTTANTYTGLTTIAGGTVVLAKTNRIAIAGNILMSEPGDGSNTFLRLEGNNEIASSSIITFSTPVAYSHLDLNGHSQTLAGINSDPWATIEGLWDNTGLNTNSTLTINNTADCTFQGVIRDSATGTGTGKVRIVKAGTGTLLLTNNDNSYTGGTTVSGGTLQIGDGNNYGVLPTTGGAVVNSSGTLYFCRSDGYSYTGGIYGSGTVKIYQGASGVSMGSGYNTSLTGFSGTASIQSGVVYLRTANGLGSGTINMGSGANLLLWTSATTTFSDPIILSGLGGSDGSYAKPTLYGDGGAGTYTLSGQITLAATSDVGNCNGNGMMTLSGKVTGAGGLVLGKLAPTLADEFGSITVSGSTSNDYTGGTTINRGTVYLAKTSGAIAVPGNVTINTATTAATGSTMVVLSASDQITSTAVMNFSGVYGSQWAYFNMLGNSQTLAGINDTSAAGVIEHAESESNITTNSTLTVNTTSADSYFNGFLRDGNFGSGSTGTLALVKGGSYKLTLVGPNVSGYTGGTTVNTGTLQFGDGTTNAALPGNASVASGATIAFDVAASTSCTYSGVISGAGSVTILGAGSITLSGANTYTGTTVAQNANGNYGFLGLSRTSGPAVQGKVVMNGCYWLVTGAANQFGTNSSVQFLAPAEFVLLGHNQTVTGISDTEGHGVIEVYHPWYANPTANCALVINNSTDCFYNGLIYNGPGGSSRVLGISKTGAGKLTLAANAYGIDNAWTGGTTINGGTLQIGDGSTNAVLPGNVVDNAALVFNAAVGTSAAYSGVVSGTGSVSSIGAGTLTLSGTAANTYSGGTTVSQGRLVLAKSAGVAAIPGNVTINTLSSASSYLVLGASGQIATSSVMTFSPTAPYYSCFEVYGKSQQLAGISDATGRGVIENSDTETGVSANGTLTISNSADCSYNGYIRNCASGSTGLLALVKTGTGKLTLSGVNCGEYTGGLTVSGGTLDYSAGSLPSCAYVINGGTLSIGSLSKSIGTFQITGGAVTGTGTLTSSAAYDVRGGTVNAVLAGASIGLNKTGSGTAVLNGANTYTGRTTLASGVLELGLAARSAVLSLGGADIQSGRMIFDYVGGSDPAAAILDLLTGSYHGALWDVGQFRDSTTTSTGLTLGWLDNATSQTVTVMATYPGDFNLDGIVNATDMSIMRSSLGGAGTWATGDANYDGYVNLLDWNLWKTHLGLPQLLLGGGSQGDGTSGVVPEPGTLVLLVVALMGMCIPIWRTRKQHQRMSRGVTKSCNLLEGLPKRPMDRFFA
jgi:autotransporter-associated beta strand protein